MPSITATTPSCGGYNPLSTLRMVVLPTPLGPTRLVICPEHAVKLMSTTPGHRRRPAPDPPLGASDHASAVPAIPPGAIQRTPTWSVPKKSKRYSARLDKYSGRRTMSTAPIRGPNTIPALPMITVGRNRIDWTNGKALRLTNVVNGAKSAPASPAVAADSESAMVRSTGGLRPRQWAATSASRTARRANPHGPTLISTSYRFAGGYMIRSMNMRSTPC
jgi:hypothetical protein